ncbi:MAG: hypothetical protein LIO38_04075, partial [Cloacibacillus sp.]|nr:hypothetical protein [Cloacibacillus sp.]
STLFMDGGSFGGGVGNWLRRNVAAAVERNPFDSIFGLLWVAGCVALAAFFIYLFNYSFCLSKAGLEEGEKKKLALSLAVFTAPISFFCRRSGCSIRQGVAGTRRDYQRRQDIPLKIK